MKTTAQSAKILIVYAFMIILWSGNPLSGQVPTNGDCLGAIPVCQDVYYEPHIFSGTGTYPNEIPNCSPSFCTTCCPNNCLDGEWNSAWYIFTVQQSGLLRFTIQPDVYSDDYDWAVFNLTDNRCEDIYSLVNLLQVSCNAAAFNNETGMNSLFGGTSHCNFCGTNNTSRWNCDLLVLAGQTFVLYVSNWGSGAAGGYTLDFTASTAVIFDDVPPEILSVDADQVSGCSETEITIHFTENVTCQWITPAQFEIQGPGGPYQVTEVFGTACAVGGDWEKEYTLTVDHPFSSNGSYALYLTVGFPCIQDACGNIALSDTIPFDLDLGAPVLDESGLVIEDATCGMENGSITGLIAAGQSSLTYVWKNEQGAIVGNTLDIINILAGNYYLEIYDLLDCITYGGPYQVEEIGAPEIDDDDIVITSSNFGSNSGSITGIIVISSYIIEEYTWRDDNSNVVGNELDLTNVSSGYYDLTVIDENTCEAYAGPYFVGEIGGPLTANPSADPDVICKGETAILSPGAGGGIGDYFYSWTSMPAGFTSTLEHPVVAPTVDTRYYIQITDHDLQITDSVDVSVHQLPVPDAGEDQSIPHGVCTFLDGSASNGSGDYNYFWTPVEKLEDATVQNPQTKNLYETTPFNLEIEDAQTGCVSEGPDIVIVSITGGILSANPSSFPDSVFCIGETFWLHANAGGGSGGYTYTWTSEPAMSLPSSPSFSLALFDYGTYYFYVKVNDGYNEAFGYVTVTVNPAPIIDLGAAVQYYCLHETITLDAGNEGASYLWSNGDTNRYTTIGTTGLNNDEQYISVSVLNAEGCQSDTGVTVIFDYDYCFGIGENEHSLNANVFPNPSTGKIMIEVYDVSGPVEVQVFNILGELRYRDGFKASADGHLNQEIDLSALAKGIYLLQIHTNDGLMTAKLIIQ
ncbi:MAG: T9SS type A sorting domain-containing protein [Bacteroidales bacterium]|nr:T9SS type A sorting domain-containing protein [Bacteroidales bacterium]